MFWISKKTNYFKEIWNNDFIDIHNHLLPGIDDGSKSAKNTFKMIEEMKNLGISQSIVTPHVYPGLWENSKESIQNSYATVGTDFISNYSAEYFADCYLLELEKEQALLPIKDNYLLIEFSLIGPPNDAILDALFQLKLKGYNLILAHPERYQYWNKKINLFENLKAFDLSFQLNSLSIIGYYGKEIQQLSEELLKKGYYEFLGTDFHNLKQIEYTKNNPFSRKLLEYLELLVKSNNSTFNK